MVALNRAAALAEIEGPAAVLAETAPLSADKRMAEYQPYWAARGHLLASAGHRAEAHDALTMAIGLSTDDAVRHHLLYQHERLGALSQPMRTRPSSVPSASLPRLGTYFALQTILILKREFSLLPPRVV